MAGEAGSPRGAELAARLERVASAFIAMVETVDPDSWGAVPNPGVWSIGKDAAHVAEATAMHQWMVRRTIGEAVAARRPPIERTEMTTTHTPAELARMIRERADEGAILLRGLTEDQLQLPTKPPRARGERLSRTIERVLIRHYETHRAEIARKLRAMEHPR